MHSSDSESPHSPEVFGSSDDEQHDGTNDIACDSDEETGSVSHDHLEEPPYKTPSTRNIAEWFCARKPTIRSGMQNAISSHRAEHGVDQLQLLRYTLVGRLRRCAESAWLVLTMLRALASKRRH